VEKAGGKRRGFKQNITLIHKHITKTTIT